MRNRISNASGLDGVTSWTALAGAISVDDTVRGASGRIAISASGAGAAIGDTVGLKSAAAAVTPGETILAAAFASSDNGAAQVTATFLTAGGATVGAPVVVGQSRSATTTPLHTRGLKATFAQFFSGALVVPGTAATAVLTAKATATAAGAWRVDLLKPFLGSPQTNGQLGIWDPGPHANPDLQLPAWPADLRPFHAGAPPTPIANAKAWRGDAGAQVREDVAGSLYYEFRGRLRATPFELDLLTQFYFIARSQFWLVNPFTDELCIAEWMEDGAPKITEDRGPSMIVEVGLQLMVS